MTRRITLFLASFVLLSAFTCCTSEKGKQLPASTGQPYEVVLEGDTADIVTEMLSEDVPCLPQPEPLCNLIQVKRGKMKGSYLLVRNRVVVDINQQHKAFKVKMGKDENATPQYVIRIQAKSIEQLKQKLNPAMLRSVIDQHELEHLANITKRNPEKEKEVRQLFGIDMKIPLSMDASKKAKGFLWLSNNASSGMQNLIIFRLKGSGCKEPNAWTYSLDEINKVLKPNIQGETDNMHMQLIGKDKRTKGDEISKRGLVSEYDENLLPLERGLWEMKGDAMGGPYLMKMFPMSKGKIITPRSFYEQPSRIDSRIVIIGFVYAPEMKKRNLTKQLEAVISTIR